MPYFSALTVHMTTATAVNRGRLRISLRGVPAIGDSLHDLHAAKAAGARPILVRTGKGAAIPDTCTTSIAVPVYDNLACAVDDLLAASQRANASTR